jgi:hypothetical protein
LERRKSERNATHISLSTTERAAVLKIAFHYAVPNGRMISDRHSGRLVLISGEQRDNFGTKMVPVYAARIEDLGPGDFVKVDCTACSHRALLAPVFLDRLGLDLTINGQNARMVPSRN